MKIPADEAPAALKYGQVALASVKAVTSAAVAITEACAVGSDIRDCKAALRKMDRATERADLDLTRLFVPASFNEIHKELLAAVANFRQAARIDLEGRETENPELLDQATTLAEQGNARFEKVTTILHRMSGLH